MSAPLVLSGSSIATFLRCGQQWYYAYVLNIKSPPTVRQAVGVAAHAAIEHDMTQKISSLEDVPVDELLDAFNDSYETEIADYEPSESDSETPAEGKDSGIGLIKLAAHDVLPNVQPVMVEKPIQFAVDEIPYSGVIDLVDFKGRVRDWKTTKRRPASGSSYLLQMTGYAIAYRQLTGEEESEVVLDHFVRTKMPQYVPIASGGPVSPDALVTFAEIVKSVHGQIQAGRFVPNGLMSQACTWCGYKQICPAYKEYRAP